MQVARTTFSRWNCDRNFLKLSIVARLPKSSSKVMHVLIESKLELGICMPHQSWVKFKIINVRDSDSYILIRYPPQQPNACPLYLHHLSVIHVQVLPGPVQ